MTASKDPGLFHFYVSLAKSAVRIAAGVAFCLGSIFIGGALLIFAETLGIIEEL